MGSYKGIMFGTTWHTRVGEEVLNGKNALIIQEILCEKMNQRILRIREVKGTEFNIGSQIQQKKVQYLHGVAIVQLKTKMTPLLCHRSSII